MRRLDDRASTALMGLIVASALFSMTFVYVVESGVENSPSPESLDETNHESLAASLAEAILARGSGWYLVTPCLLDIEQPVDGDGIGGPTGRFGLGAEACDGGKGGGEENLLAYSKIQALYGSQLVPGANDLADYEDARTSLGLDASKTQFHLRAWPVVPSAGHSLQSGAKDPYLRPLYVGDYSESGGGGSGPPPHTKGIIDSADQLVVWIRLTNDGATATAFEAHFEMELKNEAIEFTLHTNVLNAGESGNLSFTLLKTADWQWKNNPARKVHIDVRDKDSELIDTDIDLSGVTMTHALTRQNHFAQAEKLTFPLVGGSVNAKYLYASYDGKGNLRSLSDWTYRAYDSTGALTFTDVLPATSQGTIERPFVVPGTWTAKLGNDAGTLVWNQDNVNIVLTEPGSYEGAASTYAPGSSVADEVRFLDALVEHFDANVYSATYEHASMPYSVAGDVYPDIKKAMDDDLPLALTESGQPTLARYTTLVVGSNVDHNAMTSNAAKDTIRDWVYAGGTLIVFGSDDQTVNWLQPIFHASLDEPDGGATTQDPTHPILHIPNALDHVAFTVASEWEYNSGSDAYFSHVITAGPSGDVLAVGNTGQFGDGRLVLTGWRPHDLTPDQSTMCPATLDPALACQGLFLMHNFITLSYREFYIEYGPDLPTQSPAASTTRIVHVYHPELEQTVPLALQVWVFSG